MVNVLKKISHWLLPFTCILCKNLTQRTQDLCYACLQELPILTQGCAQCANILTAPDREPICGPCLTTPPPFEKTYALFSYQPPITRLIMDLKFQHALVNARILGELLANKIRHVWYQNTRLPTAIIPLPLHVTRLQERGFNQAIEIARPLAKLLQLPLWIKNFSRCKPTLAQTTLSAKIRQKNLRGAFHVNTNLANQHVAVLDDVITTGSTMTEFCYALKQQGAGKIDVWCCARVLRPR